MVRFLSLFLALICSPAMAGLQTGVTVAPAIGLGGVGTSTTGPMSQVPISNLAGGTGTFATFSLYGGGALTAQNAFPLFKNGVAYQVPATCNGHACTAYCFNITTAAGSASVLGGLLSATVAFTTNASAVTGGVFQCGASSTTLASAFLNCMSAEGGTAGVLTLQPGTYNFGASTFAGFGGNNTATYNVHMDCYEN